MLKENHVSARDCDCIFNVEINYYFKTLEDELAGNPTFYKDATLIRVCHQHERIARENALKQVKREEKKDTYFNCASFLKGYENEIKIAKYRGVVAKNV